MANIGDRLLLYLFPSFQHPGVLADPCHVFHHPLLHHYEETDQGSDHFRDQQINFGVKDFTIWLFCIAAHDQIPLPSIHLGETKVPGKLSSIFSFTPLAFSHWPANQFDHFWPDQNYVLSFTFSFTGEWGGWRRQGAPFATECLISSWWFQPGGSW